MKKTIKIVSKAIFLLSLMSFMPSCETTQAETQEFVEKPASSKKSSQESAESSTTAQLKKELSNMQIELVSSADTPFAGTAFKTPYTVSVKDNDGNPYANYTLTVTYPEKKTDNVVSFGTAEIVTNEKGIAVFKPETISTSINSTVTFSPKLPGNSPSLTKLAKSVELEVPCRVKFFLKKGHIVMVDLIDYTLDGKMNLNSALSTSSNTMQEFWKAGYPYQAQNADFHKVIDKGNEAICQAAKNLVGGATYFKYIVYGKVKYESDIKEVEGGYSLTLTADITVIDFATAKELYKVTKSTTVTDKNKWNVLKACQTQLAKDLVNDLIYAM
ncbi:MAG: hypothetical protein J6Y36_05125 [Treponema sp.]|nr:hypothetical protein [Treponema sp.]